MLRRVIETSKVAGKARCLCCRNEVVIGFPKKLRASRAIRFKSFVETYPAPNVGTIRRCREYKRAETWIQHIT